MRFNVIVFGASGMVGEGVLLRTLAHESVGNVLVVGRKACGVAHPRLREIIHRDFFDFSTIEEDLRGYDACFFCLGVSSVGMKEEEYRRITYDLTMGVATLLSHLNPSMTFCYVSGQGTDGTEQGKLAWARVKGKTENDLSRLPFKATYAFRPGLIKPLKEQRNVRAIFRIVAWPFPLWRRLFPGLVSSVSDIALAMVNATMSGYPKRVLENRDIALCAKEHSAIDGESKGV
jgi:uncharacterized protein YbjT (DUF2867 family)